MTAWMALLFGSLLLGTGNIEIGEKQPDHAEIFSSVLVKTGRRLQTVAEKRPLKVKAMNDSLSSMAAAMRGMAGGAAEPQIHASLDSALRSYRENGFPRLLRAVLLNARGDTAGANREFETFLVRSRAYTDFEKTFISAGDFHKLRRVVYDLLVYRGVDFKGREKEIRVHIPFGSLLNYVMDPAPGDRILNIAFIFILTAGTIFLFWGWVGADFSRYWPATLLGFYLASWCAYGFWLADLAVGLPYGLDRFQAALWIFGIAAFFRVLSGLHRLWLYWAAPLPVGYRRCRGCRGVLPEVMLECPECGKRIGARKGSGG